MDSTQGRNKMETKEPFSKGMQAALLIFLLAFAYLVAVTFLTMPPAGEEHSKTIVGFFLGTVFATLIQYYWGSSSKGKPPDETTTTSMTTESTSGKGGENK